MYTLDLDQLNLRSPYYVWKVKDGVYAFDTDYEISYVYRGLVPCHVAKISSMFNII